ncbi:XylR N-terminal domain-containing protein [Microbacteriaceae bacterium 4G12]
MIENIGQDRLNIMQKDNKMYMDGDRFIFMPSSSFGLLRKELIENIGEERVKGFLIRYGWDLGARDARRMMVQSHLTLEDAILQGPVLHMKKGHVNVKTTYLDVEYHEDRSVKSVYMEGEWHQSYEAEEYVHYFGSSPFPVCHTLIGYASGYLSVVCNKRVICKEIRCEATGHEFCHWIGKTVEDWGEEIEKELHFFVEPKIAEELENTYEQLLEERNNLSKTLEIHKRLTEEILLGNDFHSIANVIYNTTSTPLMIVDLNCRPFAYSGLSNEEFYLIEQELYNHLHKNQSSSKQFLSTTTILTDHSFLLITPIFLHKKLFGYCSFVYPKNVQEPAVIDHMILERASAVCSLYLLNEKKEFETEQRMQGHFLEEILNQNFLLKQEIIKRGRYVNMDLNKCFYVVIVQYKSKHTEVDNELIYHDDILTEINHYLKRKQQSALVGQKASNIVILLQSDKQSEEILRCMNHLQTYLTKQFKQFQFKIGVSTEGENIECARDYYEEAFIALRMTSFNQAVITFDSLGVVGLLINSNNENALRKMAQKMLGNLYYSKCTKDTELIKTLYAYLANGGNLEHTAQDLMLSISGLRYRLQKIEATIGKELRNPMTNFQLFLMIQGLIVLGDIHM